MKKFALLLLLFILASCKNDLTFKDVHFEQKTKTRNKFDSPKASVTVPFALNKSEAADSINKKIFSIVQSIVYNEEKPKNFENYDALLKDFINQYQKMVTESPGEPFGWEANITGKVKHLSTQILNIEISHYSYTGGAHGYEGLRSLLIDPKTGKNIPNSKLFKNEAIFKKFAEKTFRQKFNIPINAGINSTELMFEDDKFQLPQHYFFTEAGLLLYYNSYEIASYAQGPQELLLTFKELEPYLALR